MRTAWIAARLSKLLNEPLIIRFEDIDGPRVVKEAQTSQTSDMRSLGIVADQVELQSTHFTRHKELFEKALRDGRIYACDCSRTEVRDALRGIASAPHTREPEYSGHCRSLARTTMPLASDRLHKPVDSIAWRWRHEDESGRFDSIVARTDFKTGEFQPGYHWACAVDDADGNYAWLVRAWDLALAEETQSRIRQWVRNLSGSVDTTRVFHTALITQNDGHRLEKRTPDVTLAELLPLGYTPEKLLELFTRSFAANPTSHPSGEEKRTLTLLELGLHIGAPS